MKTTTTKEETAMAIAMSREILDNSQSMNNVMTVSKQVRACFHTHYVNMENDLCGIEDLISEILTENDAIFPAKSETTELRPIVIAGAMFTDEILSQVEAKFTAGSKRYPSQTVKNCLSVYMRKNGKVGKVQLAGKEDKNRPCDRPRCKYYIVK